MMMWNWHANMKVKMQKFQLSPRAPHNYWIWIMHARLSVRVLVSYWIRKVLRVRNEFGLAGVQCLTRFIEINKWYCYVFVVKEWRKFGEREKNHRITLCSSIYSGFRHDNREIISHDGKNNNNRITIRIKIKIHKFPRVAWMNR